MRTCISRIEDRSYTEECFDLGNGISVSGTIRASYRYTVIPGRMYMPNGDPGYPDEYEEDLIDFEIGAIECYDEDGNEKEYELTPEEYSRFEQYMLEKVEDRR